VQTRAILQRGRKSCCNELHNISSEQLAENGRDSQDIEIMLNRVCKIVEQQVNGKYSVVQRVQVSKTGPVNGWDWQEVIYGRHGF
jgi:hypothetical protein